MALSTLECTLEAIITAPPSVVGCKRFPRMRVISSDTMLQRRGPCDYWCQKCLWKHMSLTNATGSADPRAIAQRSPRAWINTHTTLHRSVAWVRECAHCTQEAAELKEMTR